VLPRRAKDGALPKDLRVDVGRGPGLLFNTEGVTPGYTQATPGVYRACNPSSGGAGPGDAAGAGGAPNGVPVGVYGPVSGSVSVSGVKGGGRSLRRGVGGGWGGGGGWSPGRSG